MRYELPENVWLSMSPSDLIKRCFKVCLYPYLIPRYIALAVSFTIIRNNIDEAQHPGLFIHFFQREMEHHFCLEPGFVPHYDMRGLGWSKDQDHSLCCDMLSSSRHLSRRT
ncbi:hypothetical protein BYT27DRAFT_6433808 [Phlegmacium glaucopus]|nr:hypothetical protein BYT27DRAFT_6433808 [Phlegmacium glaucopus]